MTIDHKAKLAELKRQQKAEEKAIADEERETRRLIAAAGPARVTAVTDLYALLDVAPEPVLTRTRTKKDGTIQTYTQPRDRDESIRTGRLVELVHAVVEELNRCSPDVLSRLKADDAAAVESRGETRTAAATKSDEQYDQPDGTHYAYSGDGEDETNDDLGDMQPSWGSEAVAS